MPNQLDAPHFHEIPDMPVAPREASVEVPDMPVATPEEGEAEIIVEAAESTPEQLAAEARQRQIEMMERKLAEQESCAFVTPEAVEWLYSSIRQFLIARQTVLQYIDNPIGWRERRQVKKFQTERQEFVRRSADDLQHYLAQRFPNIELQLNIESIVENLLTLERGLRLQRQVTANESENLAEEEVNQHAGEIRQAFGRMIINGFSAEQILLSLNGGIILHDGTGVVQSVDQEGNLQTHTRDGKPVEMVAEVNYDTEDDGSGNLTERRTLTIFRGLFQEKDLTSKLYHELMHLMRPVSSEGRPARIKLLRETIQNLQTERMDYFIPADLQYRLENPPADFTLEEEMDAEYFRLYADVPKHMLPPRTNMRERALHGGAHMVAGLIQQMSRQRRSAYFHLEFAEKLPAALAEYQLLLEARGDEALSPDESMTIFSTIVKNRAILEQLNKLTKTMSEVFLNYDNLSTRTRDREGYAEVASHSPHGMDKKMRGQDVRPTIPHDSGDESIPPRMGVAEFAKLTESFVKAVEINPFKEWENKGF